MSGAKGGLPLHYPILLNGGISLDPPDFGRGKDRKKTTLKEGVLKW